MRARFNKHRKLEVLRQGCWVAQECPHDPLGVRLCGDQCPLLEEHSSSLCKGWVVLACSPIKTWHYLEADERGGDDGTL